MISWHVNMTWSVVISGHVPVEPLSPKDGNLRPQRVGTPLPYDGNLLFRRMGTSFPMLLFRSWEPLFRRIGASLPEGREPPFPMGGNPFFRKDGTLFFEGWELPVPKDGDH